MQKITAWSKEEEDDIPMSKLRWKENRTDNGPESMKQEYTFVTDNDTGAKKIPKGETSNHNVPQ